MTGKAYDAHNQSPEQYFESFFYYAAQACKEVEHFKPDIVLGLAHAGWAPVVATQSVWELLSPRPFPPALRTNLGREKLMPYRDQRREARQGDFYGTMSSLKDVADFLNWLDGQTELQEQLAQQIAETLGSGYPPSRLLIIDEMIAEGATWLLAVGLIDILYPGAEVRFVDGPYFNWRDVLSKHWLEEHHPELFVEMLDLLEKMKEERRWDTWTHHAYAIAPGTEDIDPRLPSWRPILPEDPDVQALSEFLPAEEWLKMSDWIYTQLRHEMRWRVAEHPDVASLLTPKPPPDWPGMDPRDLEVNRFHSFLIAKYVLRYGPINAKIAARLCGVSEELAGYMLRSLVGKRYWAEEYRKEYFAMHSTRRGPLYGFWEAEESE